MLRLHIGSGNVRLPGWTNVDAQRLPGVDVVADVTRGLDFAAAEAVFSEHFLEHLAIDDALRFLLEAHRVLMGGGWVRLTTPNLDWVWLTHYKLAGEAAERREAALAINRAFRGWRHQFLWNRETLAEALAACGFEAVRWCRRGGGGPPLFPRPGRPHTHGGREGMPPHPVLAGRQGGAPPAPPR